MAKTAQQVRQLYALCATAIVLGRADLDGADNAGFDIALPIFTVGQVGEIANIHPQTLRQYDRVGLVVPQRTSGGARRYSLRDIDRLVQAQKLSQDEGINLAGITRILELQEETRQLRRQIRRMHAENDGSVFAAGRDGDIVEMQRSTSARRWRRDIHATVRELPSGTSGYDPDSSSGSKSMILWGYR